MSTQEVQGLYASSISNVVSIQADKVWYHMEFTNNAATFVYDLSKTAFITKRSIEVCVDKNGDYLLGVQYD
ncbi:hypothetical protein RHO15_05065 [Utexia brackfieldae]|uniref:hypothetical protein n=1 Tax=Utexia brackfieldae TaxID=3074108 RepID=UPI00370D94A4